MNIAIAAQDDNVGLEAIHLSGAQAAASANVDIATAGRALVNVAIRAGAAGDPDQVDEGKIRAELVEAQQAVLKACTAVLGDQPW